MIQIDAGIIVSPYLVACRPERLLRRWQMAELIIIPQGAGMATFTINGFTAITGTRTRRLRHEIGHMMTLFLPRCMLGLRIKGQDDDVSARRTMVGLGACGGCGGATTGRRCRA
jgi:hypothetical protein